MQNKKISIIMPAFNEETHIVESLKETILTFDNFKSNYEIIVVDDGSQDKTYEIALNFAKIQPAGKIKVQRNRENFGKGRAIVKGCRFAKGDYLIFLDADMDLHPRQIDTFFDLMELTDTDVVIGSKQHPNSRLIYPWYRKVMSLVYYWMIKLMFGLPLHDTQTGLKLFKAEVLKTVLPRILIKQFAFDLEILANAYKNGYKIAEAPISLSNQRGLGRIGLWAIWKTCIDTLAIYYRMYIIKYYDRTDAGHWLPLQKKRSGLHKKKTMKKRIKNVTKLLTW